jgi:hypothetical protein
MITDQAPYAPAPGVITVLDRYRDTGLGGAKITPDLVKRMSIGATVADRVVDTLTLLDLIGDDGTPTDTFKAFKAASSESYLDVFRQVLLNAYKPVFDILGEDLVDKTITDIEDAFRTYRPESLRSRMVTLFLGLCRYAGMEVPGRRSPGAAQATPRPRRPVATGRNGKAKSRGSGPPDTPTDVVFGVSEEDIAVLSEDEFDAVWSALGTVARARARARQAPAPAEQPPSVQE